MTSTSSPATLRSRYASVRALTEDLAAPLSPEDQQVQSMADVSPTKWHRAHTTWFFETLVLAPNLDRYEPFDPDYGFLFNSYYESVGPRHARPKRGLITRPSVHEIVEYRQHVDRAVGELLDRLDEEPASGTVHRMIELGLHHEQQHQELLLMDIKHVLGSNPLHPAYRRRSVAPASPTASGWVQFAGGICEIGHRGEDFAFDNEGPCHRVLLEDFELSDRLVTCEEWLEFIDAGGYEHPLLWLSDGWHRSCEEGWTAPEYWFSVDGEWHVQTLGGPRPIDPAEPVCHISYYEADAFARWAGARLPLETEWEHAVAGSEIDGNFVGSGALHPLPAPDGDGSLRQAFGDLWEWTASSYSPYPRFRPDPGAVGEYNGKFMVNQFVLRGGSCATPDGHVRHTYRNFFPPHSRWMFSGLRLARSTT